MTISLKKGFPSSKEGGPGGPKWAPEGPPSRLKKKSFYIVIYNIFCIFEGSRTVRSQEKENLSILEKSPKNHEN